MWQLLARPDTLIAREPVCAVAVSVSFAVYRTDKERIIEIKNETTLGEV